MYDLHLTAEQLEFRDTVRDFVEREIKPIALHPNRLEPFEKPLLLDILDKASRMGLRTLALSQELGGAGADNLTSCIVMEELAAGDVDIAATLAQTSTLARVLFDQAMTPEQRTRFLPQFLADDRYHLAFADEEPDPDLRWKYYRPTVVETDCRTTAVRQGNGDWVVNGVKAFVANAPIAKLIAVQVKIDPKTSGTGGVSPLLVSRDTPGLTVRDYKDIGRQAGPDGGPSLLWYHGTRGEVVFKDCRVPANYLLGKEGENALSGAAQSVQRGIPQFAAINIGIGRVAYEAAVDYAKLRVQGGRHIIEHQAIGTILADIAIKLEVARNTVWKAAWALDHPDAVARRSLSDLSLQTIAKVFTSEVLYEVALDAQECFGGMGVMRDMPLPKYVHDARIFLHSGESNSVAKFRIAEAVAGFR